MHRPTTLRYLDALSLDELMLSALYHHLIDGADRAGDRVLLWIGNQRLVAAEDEARHVLLDVLIRQPHLSSAHGSTASPN